MTNQLTRSTLDRTTRRPTPTPTFQPPSVPSAPQPGSRRRWLVPAGVAAAAVVAVVGVAVLGSDSPDGSVDQPPAAAVEVERPSYLIVQDYIDASLAENRQVSAANAQAQRPVHLVMQDYIDGSLAERKVNAENGLLSSQQTVQYYIDASLAERQLEDALVKLPAAQIVQHYIDASLAENRASSSGAVDAERPAYLSG